MKAKSRKPRRTARKTRRTVRRRIPKTLSYKGNLAISRTTNLATNNGFVVDGTNLFKSGNKNLCFVNTALSSAGDTSYGSASLKVRLIDVINNAELSVLYDSYTIDKVVVKFLPFATSASAGAAITSSQAQMNLLVHSVYDFDDADLPPASETGVNEMRERSRYKRNMIMTGTGRKLSWTFKPKVNQDIYAGAVSGNGNPIRSASFGWVNCDDNLAEGYGLKMIIEAVNPGAGQAYFFYFKGDVTYYMRFKDTR